MGEMGWTLQREEREEMKGNAWCGLDTLNEGKGRGEK